MLKAFMHEGDRHAALTDPRRYALDRPAPNIADGKNSQDTRFEHVRLAGPAPLVGGVGAGGQI